ncbi:MAG: PleD family two-component system response regulator [Sphingomonadales bacterium]
MPTCLVVDDSKIIRKVAKRILAELDFEAQEAGDGSQALASVEQHKPDVVLLDWNMPVMDGLEFLEALRRHDGGQPTVIFCTCNNKAEHIRKALEAGADDYIMKPFDREILLSKFEQAGLC